MRTSVNRYRRTTWAALLLFALAAALPAAAQQGTAAGARGAQAKLEIEAKTRYFLGETPAVRISLTNAGRAPQSVKEAEYRKFSLEMTGRFENADAGETKHAAYNGSWDIPKETPKPLPGMPQEWPELKKREPKFVTLAPGEATTLELNLSETFRSYLGVSKYHLVVKTEDGQQVVKDFEVYFDEGQSFPLLSKMLASEDTAEHNWALYNLVTFGRPRLVTLLEGWAKSGDEKQRDLAREVLIKLAAGRFDPVKLRVENKERYFQGEAPVVAVSIYNGSSTVLTMKEAASQKFSFELTRVADSKRETKTCVYDGGREVAKPSAGRDKRKPAVVKLGETDSTTLTLNLSECLRARLDAGSYELAVTAPDEPAVGGQKVVKRFEVYFDEGRSVPALAQLLKSDDAAEQRWAVSALAQYSRPRLVALLEELMKSGNEKQRDFAGRILKEIKAGNFG
jgi:hypothetical protein